MLTIVSQNTADKDYQRKFEYARSKIKEACAGHISSISIVLFTMKRYHSSEPEFQSKEFYEFIKGKVANLRQFYFKYFKLVDVDQVRRKGGVVVWVEPAPRLDAFVVVVQQADVVT